ncbi:hypothetical protein, partial [Mesorhizobium sp. M0520]|uniref:hypothetical protein n=1 Tax=Mesorhizobium sp. M0520 TaxID=2956957 RepID=UPI003335BBCB
SVWLDGSCLFRNVVLRWENCLEQESLSRRRGAARLVLAAQIVAGSFKVQVCGGKVACHRHLPVARPPAR